MFIFEQSNTSARNRIFLLFLGVMVVMTFAAPATWAAVETSQSLQTTDFQTSDDEDEDEDDEPDCD